MIIFADLLALLMTFFVMLISMNTVEIEKWNSIVTAFSDAFNPARESISLDVEPKTSEEQEELSATISLDYLYAVFEEAVAPNKNVLGLHVSRLEDRVVISLPSDFLFSSQQVDYAVSTDKPRLSDEGKILINNLSAVFEQLANDVSIVGHVSPAYAGQSPWIQSIKYAGAVQQVVYNSGYSGLLSIYGLGNSRFEVIDQTILPEVRVTIGSRVDIEVKEQAREQAKERGFN